MGHAQTGNPLDVWLLCCTLIQPTLPSYGTNSPLLFTDTIGTCLARINRVVIADVPAVVRGYLVEGDWYVLCRSCENLGLQL